MGGRPKTSLQTVQMVIKKREQYSELTMKDIAKLCGTSSGSVSRILQQYQELKDNPTLKAPNVLGVTPYIFSLIRLAIGLDSCVTSGKNKVDENEKNNEGILLIRLLETRESELELLASIYEKLDVLVEELR